MRLSSFAAVGRQAALRPQRPAAQPRQCVRAAATLSRRLQPVLAVAAGQGVAAAANPITLTDAALAHLHKLRAESGGDSLLLRMGVKSGGCSGMSYVMDFEEEANIKPDDMVMTYGEGSGFRLVCDPKSLLYLFGMQLDYSGELIGGGFKFANPNAESACGCGKSFGV